MSNLHIIGNGFDQAHNLKTSYAEFRNFLLVKNVIEKNITFRDLEPVQMPDGELKYESSIIISLIFNLISDACELKDDWSNIETAMSKFDFTETLDDYCFSDDENVDEWEIAAFNEANASNIVIPVIEIQNLFSKWVKEIKIENAICKKDYSELISKDDFFFTFNYTNTLEEIYKINADKICHIHGEQGREIYFGHGSQEDRYDEFMGQNIGSENYLSYIQEALRKKTEKALENNQYFFNTISEENIDKIYSYGFSFNDVDDVYIQEFIKRIDTTKVTWYFNDYDEANIDIFTRKLEDFGFKGKFNKFHISSEVLV